MLTARCKFLISSVLLIKVSVSPAGCASLHTSSSTSTNCMSEFLFTFACVCTSVRYNPPPISSFSFTVQSLQEAVCCQHGSAKSAQPAQSAQYLQSLHSFCTTQLSAICCSADHVWAGHCSGRHCPLQTRHWTLDTGHSKADVLSRSLSRHLA